MIDLLFLCVRFRTVPIVRFKVCCISSIEEARMAVEAGASAIGLVSSMPSGPGVISEETIASIAACVPPGISTFLLTSLRNPNAIIEQQRRCRANTLQLCDCVEPSAYRTFHSAMPGVKIVQVINVTDENSIEEAKALAGHGPDALLLDSGRPYLSVKELGGTGRIHNWQISTAIRESAGIPVWLAGGLNPSNVAEAISQVQPFGVDVCSGLRTDGRLDREKLQHFADEVG